MLVFVECLFAARRAIITHQHPLTKVARLEVRESLRNFVSRTFETTCDDEERIIIIINAQETTLVSQPTFPNLALLLANLRNTYNTNYKILPRLTMMYLLKSRLLE
jgi:hypothetical protein